MVFSDRYSDLEEIINLITKQAPIGIIITQNNEIEFINDTVAEIIGYSTQEIKSWELKDVEKLFREEDLKKELEFFYNQFGDKIPIPQHPYNIVTKYGKQKWVEMKSDKIFFHGKPANLLILSDITERELKLQTLFEKALNPITVINEKGQFIDANKSALEFLECSMEELLAKKVYDWVPPEMLEKQNGHDFCVGAMDSTSSLRLSLLVCLTIKKTTNPTIRNEIKEFIKRP